MQVRRRTVLEVLRPFQKGIRKYVAGLWLATVVSQFYLWVNPKIFQILIDRVICQGHRKSLLIVIGGLILVYVIRFLGDILRLGCNNRLEKCLAQSIREEVLEKIFMNSYADFINKAEGDWRLNIIEDVEMICMFIKQQIVDYYIAIVGGIVCLLLLVKIHGMLAILGTCTVVLTFILDYILGKKRGEIADQVRKLDADYYSFEFQTFQNWKEIRVERAEGNVEKEYEQKWRIKARAAMEQIKYWCMSEILSEFEINYLGKVCIYIFSIPFMLRGEITLAQVIMFSMYFQNLYQELSEIKEARVNIQVYEPQYKRIMEILQKTGVNGNDRINQIETLEFKNIGFSYPGTGKMVITNFSYRWAENSRCMITGRSGIGKSTLILLLAGIYRPDRGSVCVNDSFINDSMQTSVNHDTVGIVLQKSYLYHESVMDNICVGRTFDSDKWKFVIQCCELEDLIEKKGRDYIIEENGDNLSGGEQQRIVLARELYKEPSVLVLDEATSALDDKTEKVIFKNICGINTIRLLIYVTHRESLRKYATQILEIGE